jgi:probable phosphoglycerate mutase
MPLMVSREDAGVKPEVWLVRHGETEWSAAGRHTGRTDVPLTEAGRAEAAALAPVLAGRRFALVLSSPASRARETAAIAGFASAVLDDDLQERDYGEVEGRTTAEMQARGPEWAGWTVWAGPVPGGESLDAVAARCRRVLARADAAGGDVLLFGHAHTLRVLAVTALDMEPVLASRFALGPAALSVVGFEREVRVIRLWNRAP